MSDSSDFVFAVITGHIPFRGRFTFTHKGRLREFDHEQLISYRYMAYQNALEGGHEAEAASFRALLGSDFRPLDFIWSQAFKAG